jgi:hypothetical protein
MPTSVLDALALTYVVEERVQQRYHDHMRQAGQELRLAETLQMLATDEEWRVRGVHHWLMKREKQEGRTRVAAALDYHQLWENLLMLT